MFLAAIFHLKKTQEHAIYLNARLAQSVERQALNLVAVGSIPTIGALNFKIKYN